MFPLRTPWGRNVGLPGLSRGSGAAVKGIRRSPRLKCPRAAAHSLRPSYSPVRAPQPATAADKRRQLLQLSCMRTDPVRMLLAFVVRNIILHDFAQQDGGVAARRQCEPQANI